MSAAQIQRLAALAQMIADARLHRLRLARDEMARIEARLNDLNRPSAPASDLPGAAAAARHAIWAAHRRVALDGQRDTAAAGSAAALAEATRAFGRAAILQRWAQSARKP